MPFPAEGRVDPDPARWPARLGALRAAGAAQLVAFPAGAVASEYVGTGAAGYVTAALAGLSCAAAARAAAGAGRWAAIVGAAYAVLAVALGYRLVPGGADPLPTTGPTAASYAAAVVGALLAVSWSGRR